METQDKRRSGAAMKGQAMTDTPDTSPEAVERLRERLLLNTPVITQEHMDAATEIMPQAAATLRSLSAERDALKAELAEAVEVLRKSNHRNRRANLI